jgi:hypothetical protein
MREMGLLERGEIRRCFEVRFERLSLPVVIHVLRWKSTALRRPLRPSRRSPYFVWAFPIFTDIGSARVCKSSFDVF